MKGLVLIRFLLSAAAIVLGETSNLVSRQAVNQSCTSECGLSLNSTLTCVSSPDPYCHCSDFLTGSQACSTCLNETNTTFDGFFNASYVNFIVGVCSCQIPECGNLTLVEKQCQLSKPNDPTCRCPATVQYGPVCYDCLKQHITDPFVINGIDATLAFCQSTVMNASSSAKPSGSAISSQSSLPTFASEASVFSKVSGSLCVGIVGLIVSTVFGV